jgi:hypothetical protein
MVPSLLAVATLTPTMTLLGWLDYRDISGIGS